MPNKHIVGEPVASTIISHRFSHAVWGAIFSGAFIVVVSQMILAFLGASIGLSTLNIVQGNNIKALSIGAIIWWIISGCIAFYLGGLVSGRFSGIPRRIDGMLHGLTSFAITTIFSFLFLTTSLGAVIAGGLGLFNSGIQSAAAAAPSIANGVQSILPPEMVNGGMENVRNEIRQVYSQIQNPQQRQNLSDALMALATTKDIESQKQQVVTILTQSGSINQAQAQHMVNRWSKDIQDLKQNVQEAEQTAAQSAQNASRAAAGMAFASFIMLILGAFFAGWGGAVGAPHWADEEIV